MTRRDDFPMLSTVRRRCVNGVHLPTKATPTSGLGQTETETPHQILVRYAAQSGYFFPETEIGALNVRFPPVASTSRRNTCVKFLCRRFKPQRFAWSFI